MKSKKILSIVRKISMAVTSLLVVTLLVLVVIDLSRSSKGPDDDDVSVTYTDEIKVEDMEFNLDPYFSVAYFMGIKTGAAAPAATSTYLLNIPKQVVDENDNPYTVTHVGYIDELYTEDAEYNCFGFENAKPLDFGAYATKIVKIVIPETIVYISNACFRKCTKLVEIETPFIGPARGNLIYDETSIWINNVDAIIPDFDMNFTEKSEYSADVAITKYKNLGYFFGYKGLTGYNVPSSSPLYNLVSYKLSKNDTPGETELPDDMSSSDFFVCPKTLTTVTVTGDISEADQGEQPNEYLGNYSFSGYTTLTSITIGREENQSIEIGFGQSIFYGCTKLEEANLYCSFDSSYHSSTNGLWGPYMFTNCKKLKKVFYPENAQKIDISVFADCISLTQLNPREASPSADASNFNFPSGVEEISAYSFYKTAFTMVDFSQTTQMSKIGKFAFSECGNLVEINFSSTSTKDIIIGKSAFNGCTALENIVIPNSVTEIGDSVLSGCKNLVSISLPFVGQSRIPYTENGYGGISYVLPSSAEEIEKHSLYYIVGGKTKFTNLKNLTSIYITDDTIIIPQAFQGCYNITNLAIAGSRLKIISAGAISECYKLEQLTLPFVGGSAEEPYDEFNNSFLSFVFSAIEPSLTSQIIKNYYYTMDQKIVKKSGIQVQTMYIPKSLKEVIITDGGNVQSYAFAGLTSLEKVVINKANSIGESAFYGCSGLKEITLPFVGKQSSKFTVTSNNFYEQSFAYIFGGSKSDLQLDSHKQYVGPYPGSAKCSISYTTSNVWLSNIPAGLKKITILNDEYVGKNAFMDLKSVEQIEIRDAGTIEQGAIADCISLNTLIIPFIGQNINQTSNSLFAYIFTTNSYVGSVEVTQTKTNGGSITAYIPETLKNVSITKTKTVYAYSFADCSTIETIEFKNGLTNIANSAFRNCTNLNTVIGVDAAGISYIGSYAFAYTAIRSLGFLSTSVQEIGSYAFAGTYIQSFDIEEVSTIGAYAFADCNYLTQIRIRKNVKSIGAYAFANCPRLAIVTYENASLSKGMFKNCPSLISFDAPAVSAISDEAFMDCVNLTSINLTSTCKTLGSYAFKNCEKLITNPINSGVVVVKTGALENCVSLPYVRIPMSTKSIASGVFVGCNPEFYIETYLVESARPAEWITNWNCSWPVYVVGMDDSEYFNFRFSTDIMGYVLTSVKDEYKTAVGPKVTIPKSYNSVVVKEIGAQAFLDASNIKQVFIYDNIDRIGSDIFPGNKPDVYMVMSMNDKKDYIGKESDWIKSGRVYYQELWSINPYGQIEFNLEKLVIEYDRPDESSDPTVFTYNAKEHVLFVKGATLGELCFGDATPMVFDKSSFKLQHYDNIDANRIGYTPRAEIWFTDSVDSENNPIYRYIKTQYLTILPYTVEIHAEDEFSFDSYSAHNYWRFTDKNGYYIDATAQLNTAFPGWNLSVVEGGYYWDRLMLQRSPAGVYRTSAYVYPYNNWSWGGQRNKYHLNNNGFTGYLKIMANGRDFDAINFRIHFDLTVTISTTALNLNSYSPTLEKVWINNYTNIGQSTGEGVNEVQIQDSPLTVSFNNRNGQEITRDFTSFLAYDYTGKTLQTPSFIYAKNTNYYTPVYLHNTPALAVKGIDGKVYTGNQDFSTGTYVASMKLDNTEIAFYVTEAYLRTNQSLYSIDENDKYVLYAIAKKVIDFDIKGTVNPTGDNWNLLNLKQSDKTPINSRLSSSASEMETSYLTYFGSATLATYISDIRSLDEGLYLTGKYAELPGGVGDVDWLDDTTPKIFVDIGNTTYDITKNYVFEINTNVKIEYPEYNVSLKVESNSDPNTSTETKIVNTINKDYKISYYYNQKIDNKLLVSILSDGITASDTKIRYSRNEISDPNSAQSVSEFYNSGDNFIKDINSGDSTDNRYTDFNQTSAYNNVYTYYYVITGAYHKTTKGKVEVVFERKDVSLTVPGYTLSNGVYTKTYDGTATALNTIQVNYDTALQELSNVSYYKKNNGGGYTTLEANESIENVGEYVIQFTVKDINNDIPSQTYQWCRDKRITLKINKCVITIEEYELDYCNKVITQTLSEKLGEKIAEGQSICGVVSTTSKYPGTYAYGSGKEKCLELSGYEIQKNNGMVTTDNYDLVINPVIIKALNFKVSTTDLEYEYDAQEHEFQAVAEVPLYGANYTLTYVAVDKNGKTVEGPLKSIKPVTWTITVKVVQNIEDSDFTEKFYNDFEQTYTFKINPLHFQFTHSGITVKYDGLEYSTNLDVVMKDHEGTPLPSEHYSVLFKYDDSEWQTDNFKFSKVGNYRVHYKIEALGDYEGIFENEYGYDDVIIQALTIDDIDFNVTLDNVSTILPYEQYLTLPTIVHDGENHAVNVTLGKNNVGIKVYYIIDMVAGIGDDGAPYPPFLIEGQINEIWRENVPTGNESNAMDVGFHDFTFLFVIDDEYYISEKYGFEITARVINPTDITITANETYSVPYDTTSDAGEQSNERAIYKLTVKNTHPVGGYISIVDYSNIEEGTITYFDKDGNQLPGPPAYSNGTGTTQQYVTLFTITSPYYDTFYGRIDTEIRPEDKDFNGNGGGGGIVDGDDGVDIGGEITIGGGTINDDGNIVVEFDYDGTPKRPTITHSAGFVSFETYMTYLGNLDNIYIDPNLDPTSIYTYKKMDFYPLNQIGCINAGEYMMVLLFTADGYKDFAQEVIIKINPVEEKITVPAEIKYTGKGIDIFDYMETKYAHPDHPTFEYYSVDADGNKQPLTSQPKELGSYYVEIIYLPDDNFISSNSDGLRFEAYFDIVVNEIEINYLSTVYNAQYVDEVVYTLPKGFYFPDGTRTITIMLDTSAIADGIINVGKYENIKYAGVDKTFMEYSFKFAESIRVEVLHRELTVDLGETIHNYNNQNWTGSYDNDTIKNVLAGFIYGINLETEGEKCGTYAYESDGTYKNLVVSGFNVFALGDNNKSYTSNYKVNVIGTVTIVGLEIEVPITYNDNIVIEYDAQAHSVKEAIDLKISENYSETAEEYFGLPVVDVLAGVRYKDDYQSTTFVSDISYTDIMSDPITVTFEIYFGENYKKLTKTATFVIEPYELDFELVINDEDGNPIDSNTIRYDSKSYWPSVEIFDKLNPTADKKDNYQKYITDLEKDESRPVTDANGNQLVDANGNPLYTMKQVGNYCNYYRYTGSALDTITVTKENIGSSLFERYTISENGITNSGIYIAHLHTNEDLQNNLKEQDIFLIFTILPYEVEIDVSELVPDYTAEMFSSVYDGENPFRSEVLNGMKKFSGKLLNKDSFHDNMSFSTKKINAGIYSNVEDKTLDYFDYIFKTFNPEGSVSTNNYSLILTGLTVTIKKSILTDADVNVEAWNEHEFDAQEFYPTVTHLGNGTPELEFVDVSDYTQNSDFPTSASTKTEIKEWGKVFFDTGEKLKSVKNLGYYLCRITVTAGDNYEGLYGDVDEPVGYIYVMVYISPAIVKLYFERDGFEQGKTNSIIFDGYTHLLGQQIEGSDDRIYYYQYDENGNKVKTYIPADDIKNYSKETDETTDSIIYIGSYYTIVEISDPAYQAANDRIDFRIDKRTILIYADDLMVYNGNIWSKMVKEGDGIQGLSGTAQGLAEMSFQLSTTSQENGIYTELNTQFNTSIIRTAFGKAFGSLTLNFELNVIIERPQIRTDVDVIVTKEYTGIASTFADLITVIIPSNKEQVVISTRHKYHSTFGASFDSDNWVNSTLSTGEVYLVPGEYYIEYSVTCGEGYLSDKGSFTLIVNKKKPNIVFENNLSKTYDGIVITVESIKDSISKAASDADETVLAGLNLTVLDEYGVPVSNSFVNAGVYTVLLESAETDYYLALEQEVTIEIKRVQIKYSMDNVEGETINADNQIEFVWDSAQTYGNPWSKHVQIVDSSAVKDKVLNCTFDLSTLIYENKDDMLGVYRSKDNDILVDNLSVTMNGSDISSNCEVVLDLVVKIKKRSFKYTINYLDGRTTLEDFYDGSAFGFEVVLDPMTDSSANVVVYYYLSDALDQTTTQIPSYTAPGIYYVYYKIVGDYYDTVSGMVTINIKKINRNLVIENEMDMNKEYDAKVVVDPVINVDADNLGLDSVDPSIIFEFLQNGSIISNPVNAGGYTLHVMIPETDYFAAYDNYFSYEIKKRSITISGTASKTYNGSAWTNDNWESTETMAVTGTDEGATGFKLYGTMHTVNNKLTGHKVHSGTYSVLASDNNLTYVGKLFSNDLFLYYNGKRVSSGNYTLNYDEFTVDIKPLPFQVEIDYDKECFYDGETTYGINSIVLNTNITAPSTANQFSFKYYVDGDMQNVAGTILYSQWADLKNCPDMKRFSVGKHTLTLVIGHYIIVPGESNVSNYAEQTFEFEFDIDKLTTKIDGLLGVEIDEDGNYYKTYDGDPVDIGVVTNSDGKPLITYFQYDDDGNKIIMYSTPTTVGKYSCNVFIDSTTTYQGASADFDFEIRKAEVRINWGNEKYIYNGMSQKPTPKANNENVIVTYKTYQIVDGSEVLNNAPLYAGAYRMKATLLDDNYYINPENAVYDFNIEKQTITLKVNYSANYTGSAVSYNGEWTVEYNVFGLVDYGHKFVGSITTNGVEAGKYTQEDGKIILGSFSVYGKNSTDYTSNYLVSIEQSDIVINILTDKIDYVTHAVNVTYTGEEFTGYVAVDPSVDPTAYKVVYAIVDASDLVDPNTLTYLEFPDGVKATNVCNKVIYFRILVNETEINQEGQFIFKINPMPASLKRTNTYAFDLSEEYGTEIKNPVIKKTGVLQPLDAKNVLQYTGDGDFSNPSVAWYDSYGNVLPEKPTEIGDYKVVIKVLAGVNYGETTFESDFKIKKRSVRINIEASKPYDGTAWECTNLNDNVEGLLDGHSFSTNSLLRTRYATAAIYRCENSKKLTNDFIWNNGIIEIVFSNMDGTETDVTDNYEITYNLVVTIEEAPIQYEATIQGGVVLDGSTDKLFITTYDGNPKSILINVLDPSPYQTTITYGEQRNGQFSSTNIEYTNPGSYVVYVKMSATDYQTIIVDFTIQINPQNSTITSVVYSNKTYDGKGASNPEVTYQGDGILSFEFYGTLLDGTIGNKLDSAPINVGDYFVKIKLSAGTTTSATEMDYAFKIVPASVKVTWDIDTILRYTGQQLKPAILGFDGVVAGEELEYKFVYGSSLADYAIQASQGQYVVKITTENVNYTIENPEISFYIEKCLVDLPVIPVNPEDVDSLDPIMYDTKPHTALVETDIFKVFDETQTDAGTYTVTVQLKDKKNYMWNISAEDITFPDNVDYDTYLNTVRNSDQSLLFTIVKRTNENNEITCSDIPTQPFTGNQIKPEATLTLNLPNKEVEVVLVQDVDYFVSYGTNTYDFGYVLFTSNPDGNYDFEIQVDFSIDTFVLELTEETKVKFVSVEEGDDGSYTPTEIVDHNVYDPEEPVYLSYIPHMYSVTDFLNDFVEAQRTLIHFYVMEEGALKEVEMSANEYTRTGLVVRLLDADNQIVDEATVCIIGDVNGDGLLNLTDYAAVYNHISGSILLDGVVFILSGVLIDYYISNCPGYENSEGTYYLNLLDYAALSNVISNALMDSFYTY